MEALHVPERKKKNRIWCPWKTTNYHFISIAMPCFKQTWLYLKSDLYQRWIGNDPCFHHFQSQTSTTLRSKIIKASIPGSSFSTSETSPKSCCHLGVLLPGISSLPGAELTLLSPLCPHSTSPMNTALASLAQKEPLSSFSWPFWSIFTLLTI